MVHDSGGSGRPRGGAGDWLLPIGVGAVGLLMAHHPMILSGLALVQTDPGDSRLNNAFLEHSYRWLRRAPLHQDFWSPPFFFPARDAGAYSDVLLTVAPIYWALRALGAAADSAFQGWMIAVSALNYGAAVLLFRRGWRFSAPAAVGGACLVAFGAPRINQMEHQQLVPVFFCLATLFALTRLLADPSPTRRARWGWWQVAALGLVAQLYAGFYNGWFLILALGCAAVWAVILPGVRGPVLRVLGRDAPAIAAAGVVGALALVPFLVHYLAAARELGPRDFGIIRLSLLHPWSWCYQGPGHWLWGWSAGLAPFRSLPMANEQRAGLGLVTPVVCLAGWSLGRDRPLIRVAAPVALTLMLLSTVLPGERLANLGVATAVVVAARFFRDRSRPALGLVVLAVVIGMATFDRFPSWRSTGLTLFAITLALAETYRVRREPARLLAPLLVMAWLCSGLFDGRVMVIGLAVVGLGVAAIEILARPRDRATVRWAGLGVWLVFLVGITYPTQPEVLPLALVAPVAVRASGPRWWSRVPPGPLVLAFVGAIGAIELLEAHDDLWYLVYDYLPGGQAIRYVARSSLAVLILAAIGCAAFFGSPWAARRPVRAVLLGAACLVEQGVTTPAYSKAADRARVAALAARVDRSASAFYYWPGRGVFAIPPLYHLDAMWASLAAGVPTVNGYSGGSPRAWSPLIRVDWVPTYTIHQSEIPTPREALDAWLRVNHLDRDRVQAINDGR